ncbi:MAG TPA: hypothetical protein VF407_05100, partial [Polyangiaceae bacterium]
MKRFAWLGTILGASATVLATSLFACGSDDANGSSSPVPADDASTSSDATVVVDGGPARSFKLASGGVQLLVTGPEIGFQITPANLATDTDVVEVHQEYYGVPWSAFAAGSTVPPEWNQKMQELAQAAIATGKPMFLSITMLNGSRDSLAAETTIDNGSVGSTDHWAAHCYDFSTAADAADMKKAYLAYVEYMVGVFKPAYLNIAVEVNLFFENCPTAAAGVVDLANAAYDTAKAREPSVVAFPLIQIDHLYGYSDACVGGADGGTGARDACFAANYAQIDGLKRDRFAMSSYPALGPFTKASDIPADWFSRGPAKKGEKALVAETGWNSSNIVAQVKNVGCYTIFTDTEADELAYLDFVLKSAEGQGIDVVNWWSDRDLVVSTFMTDCPCTFDNTWCAVLNQFRGPDPGADASVDTQFFGEVLAKAFGNMGLRNYDGTQKPNVYARWQSALS